MADVHHFGLHQVLPDLVRPVGPHSLLHLGGGELPFGAGGQCQHFVAGGLHRAGLVAVDVPSRRGEHPLVGPQRRPDDGEVCLGAPHQELHVHVLPLALPADELPGGFAVGVLAVAHGLFQVGFQHLFQNPGVRALGVIAVKVKHGSTSHWVFAYSLA